MSKWQTASRDDFVIWTTNDGADCRERRKGHGRLTRLGKRIKGKVGYKNYVNKDITVYVDKEGWDTFEDGDPVFISSREDSSEVEDSPANPQCCDEETENWEEIRHILMKAWDISGRPRSYFSIWCSSYSGGNWFAGHNATSTCGHVSYRGNTPLEAAQKLLRAVTIKQRVEPFKDDWTKEECLEWLNEHPGVVEYYEHIGGHLVLLVNNSEATVAFSLVSEEQALRYLVEKVHEKAEAE